MLDTLLGPTSKFVYFAIVLVLLLVLVYFTSTKKSERLALPATSANRGQYTGTGLLANNSNVYDSGADLRMLGTSFTSTDEGN